MRLLSIYLLSAFAALPGFAHEARLEAGLYQTISNRFSIPNPGGGRVLVSEDRLKFYGRLQGHLQVSEHGFVRLVVAPLSASYSYFTEGALRFHEVTLPARSAVSVRYKFNSYRAGYVHRFSISDSFSLRAGILGKIREAHISVAGAGLASTYRNVGFVPLLHLGANWAITGPWSLRFELDGAAAKQGRAFDGFLEGFYGLDSEGSGLSAGVRVLEGGAKNEKVNTFALLHYGFLAYTRGF